MSEKIKQDISIGKNLHRLRKQAGLSQEQDNSFEWKLNFFARKMRMKDNEKELINI